MSRHHYDDFWPRSGSRCAISSRYIVSRCGWRKPNFWYGRPRHRVIDGLKPKMSVTVRANQSRREKQAQNAAQMCVMAVAAVRRGGMFELSADIG